MQEYQECLDHLLWMAKTPHISKTQISEAPHVSFQNPKAYPGGCNHHRHLEPCPATPEELSRAQHLLLSSRTTPRRRCFRPSGWSFAARRLHLRDAEAELWSDCRKMQLRPHSGDPSVQDWRCWRKLTTCNTGRITSPQFGKHGELISGFWAQVSWNCMI